MASEGDTSITTSPPEAADEEDVLGTLVSVEYFSVDGYGCQIQSVVEGVDRAGVAAPNVCLPVLCNFLIGVKKQTLGHLHQQGTQKMSKLV